MPGIFQDIQTQIDQLGHIHAEVTSVNAEQASAPVTGKEEYEWYPTTMFISQDRQARYSEYEEMGTYDIINSGLDIYADDATQKNDKGTVLEIYSDNDKIKEELEWLFYKRIDVNSEMWNIVRRTCQMGDAFYEIVLQKDRKGILYLKPLPPKTVVRFEMNGRLMGFIQMIPSGETPEFDPFQMVHFKIRDDQDIYRPYGISVLEGGRRPYRQLRLMEDAMVLYRISRAPERRIFFINVGNLNTTKAEEYLHKIRQKFRKRGFVNPLTGQLDYKSNPFGVDEDFYIPVRQGQENTRVEQLPGAQNLSEIDDVKYFKDKILAALKIPRIYLQSGDEGARGWNDARSTLSQQDIRFSRTIERVQRHICEGLYKVAIVHLLLRGYKKKELYDFELELTPSSNLAELMEAEVVNNRLSQARDYFDNGFPRLWIAKNIFKIDEKEWLQLRKIREQEDIKEAELEAKKEQAAQPPEEEAAPEGEYGYGEEAAPEGGEQPAAAGEEGAPEAGQEAAGEVSTPGEVEKGEETLKFTFEKQDKYKDNTMNGKYSGTYNRLLVEGELDGVESRVKKDKVQFSKMINEFKEKQDPTKFKEEKI